ncbi:FAD:protein FMN transferase [Cryomorphaceae bacterium 1068]|nr:FAD:protein FMN transferase [Cryomorphaceae bacterium 1068]
MKYSTLFILSAILLLYSCDSPQTQKVENTDVQLIQGEAQGTTYSIKYSGEVQVEKSQIDSILRQIDLSLSAWVDESVLTEFNGTESILVADDHFLTVFFRGREVHDMTQGAFQPMIMPLVRAWGFGPDGGELNAGENLDSLRDFVNYDFQIIADESSESILFVKYQGHQMDVNGIAQGYSVDVVSDFLESEGIADYMVEIGGEVKAAGKNENEEYWRIGVDKPSSTSQNRRLEAIVTLNNAALATSGSYRKFYEKDGRKYSHTIDPSTGEPVNHNLLSATVMASNCTNADAFATAFMVMGVEETKEFLASHPEMNLEVFLIYDEEGEVITYTSEGLKKALENL